MRTGLVTARALGFVSRQARRGRRPCAAQPRASNRANCSDVRGQQRVERTPSTTARCPFENHVLQRSQLGATTVLMTNVCTLLSRAGSTSLDLERSFDGDDDDGT